MVSTSVVEIPSAEAFGERDEPYCDLSHTIEMAARIKGDDCVIAGYLDEAATTGTRFVFDAPIYFSLVTGVDRQLGRVLEGRRDKVILASKSGKRDGEGIRRAGSIS